MSAIGFRRTVAMTGNGEFGFDSGKGAVGGESYLRKSNYALRG